MYANVAIVTTQDGFAIVFHGLQALVSFADDVAQVAIEAEDKAKEQDVEPDEMVVFYNVASEGEPTDAQFMEHVRQFAKTGGEIETLKKHAAQAPAKD